ncbi:hypothetical protein [uncultured Jatrophihabitans sp.]|uniref:hypothetical protein n=1 Tax=uncultured Jatrophihabitans sp. TaxID=1610747 RepID=UPI0035CB8B81
MTMRFDGAIAGVGTASGVRLVVGMWPDSPFGPIADVMVEHADGHRQLIAPRAEVGEFIASTYGFDDVLVEPTALRIDGDRWTVTTTSLTVTMHVGRRTAVGQLLSLVPRALARQRWWCVVIDPAARAVRRGVRTHGSAGHGRHEYYCALDEHALAATTAVWRGEDLGALRPVTPPVRFGFGSTPSRPSLVRVTTLIDGADGG